MSKHEICPWASFREIERIYHDSEWGIPNYRDCYLFELLTLEGAQAGLSWHTILKKREGYRLAFQDYDITALAEFNDTDIELNLVNIIENYDVVRHKGKIRSVYKNARAAKLLQQEYGTLAAALWQFVEGGRPIVNHWNSAAEVPTSTKESKAMSQFLKQRGFTFVGETICYAFMQAVGMVNDHLVTCHAYNLCNQSVDTK